MILCAVHVGLLLQDAETAPSAKKSICETAEL